LELFALPKESKMQTQATVRRVTWRALVMIGILLVLGLAPRQGGAHDASGGISTTVDDTVDGFFSFFHTLLAVTFDFSSYTHNHHCVATASADVANPMGFTVDNKFVFALSLDNSQPLNNHGSERTIDFDDNDTIDDTGRLEVSSTFFFANITPGIHTIRWLAKADFFDGDEDLTVEDSSLTIVCTQQQLE
jgi:hypothetical protein